jgi:hypothetical protein
MILRPNFDAIKKVWFVTLKGKEIEAGSISDLLAKLGPRYSVQDYFVGNAPIKHDSVPGSGGGLRKPVVLGTRYYDFRRQAPRKLQDSSLPQVVPKEPGSHKTRPRPSNELGVASTVRPEREATPAERAMWSKRDNAILDGWASGISGPELAERFGVTPAVIGVSVVVKARRKGDPRAVVRNPKLHGQNRSITSGG